MDLLRIKCNNLYLFKDFTLDLTYARKNTHSLSKYDHLQWDNYKFPKINVRKNIIIMGANATGKSTLCSLLCGIYNYIFNREIGDNDEFNLFNAIRDKDTPGYFYIEFVIEDYAYGLEVFFDTLGIQKENLFFVKIFPSYNINTLRDRLKENLKWKSFRIDDSMKLHVEEIKKTTKQKIKIHSVQMSPKHLLSGILKINDRLDVEIKNHLAFIFERSQHKSDNSIVSEVASDEDISILNQVLPVIDNSIVGVKRVKIENSIKNDSYAIIFSNGDTKMISEGKLKNTVYNRCSEGTFEAIDFILLLARIKNYQHGTVYLDEKTTHLHSTLETVLLYTAVWTTKNFDRQLFYTSHSPDCLDLSIPLTCYGFFRRNNEGYNEFVFADQTLNKNDRNLKNYVENNFFDTLPDFSSVQRKIDEGKKLYAKKLFLKEFKMKGKQ